MRSGLDVEHAAGELASKIAVDTVPLAYAKSRGDAPPAALRQAIRLANDSRYGLSAGLFTQDLDAAMKFARQAEAGNIHLNWGPAWRADLMPYGGLKESGLGKEGPKYAIHEMTETKTIVFHLPAE